MIKKILISLLIALLWYTPVYSLDVDVDSNDILDIAYGGTNAATLAGAGIVVTGDAVTGLDGTAYRLLIVDGGADVAELTYGNTLTFLRSNGAAAAPTFSPIPKPLSMTFDPSAMYDQESTYRSVPLFYVGDSFPNGITITEWKVDYVGGDPTTELDADLICDVTPDFNTAAGATVMDVLDTTAGTSTAAAGFDSATCANGSEVYIHFGADPTDANVLVRFYLHLSGTP